MKRYLALAVLIILIVGLIPGCLKETKKDLKDENPLDSIIFPDNLPSMIVAHIENITRYEYDVDTHLFIKGTRIDAHHPRSLIHQENYYYFAYNSGIRKVDTDLNLIKEIQMEKMGVIVESKGVIYFSAGGSFYTCNSDLEILSSLNLNFTSPYGEKVVHDIIINDNIAFLVDDVTTPYYIFKVNVSNPNNISVIQRIEVVGINSHLYGQWLDIEKDRWMIIETGGIMTGSYEDIIFYSIENGSEIATQNIYWSGRDDTEEQGYHIKSILPINPTWCIILYGHPLRSSFHIANLSIDNDEISIEKVLDLHIISEMYPEYSNIEQYDDIVYAAMGDNIRLIDMKENPILIFGQTFDYYITDLILVIE